MQFWIYKCNSRNLPYQRLFGDWETFFAEHKSSQWGSTKSVPSLSHADPGDIILAYQTDRNELVGIGGWPSLEWPELALLGVPRPSRTLRRAGTGRPTANRLTLLSL